MLKRDSQNPELRHQAALAQYRVAGILAQLDRREDAEETGAEAIERLRELVANYPESPAYRHSLAQVLYRSNRFGEAISLLQNLRRNFPKNPEYQESMGEAYKRWAAQEQQNKSVSAELLTKAETLLQPLASSPNATPAQKHHYAEILSDRGLALANTEQGRADIQEAERILRELIALDPTFVRSRERLAHVLWWSANLYPPEDTAKLVSVRVECVKLFEGLVHDFPLIPNYRRDLAMARMHLALAYYHAGNVDQEREQLVQAKQTLAEVCREFPEYPDGFGLMFRVRPALVVHYEMEGPIDEWLREAEEYKSFLLERGDRFGDTTNFHYAGLLELWTGGRLVKHGREAEGLKWARQGFQRAWNYLEEATKESKGGHIIVQFEAIRGESPEM